MTDPANKPAIPPGRHVILCCDCEGTQTELSRIFRVIQEAAVPANFFFVGETCRQLPQLVEEISRHHQTESHTWSHPNLRKLDADHQRREIMGGKAAVEDTIGRATRGFRAPMHHVNRDTVRILNEEGFVFDASRLYFRYDMEAVHEIEPTWFREWMPLYETLRLKPRTAFRWFRLLTRLMRLSVLPVHPQYSGKSPELADGFAWFLRDAKERGVRFWSIDDWLAETRGVAKPSQAWRNATPPAAERVRNEGVAALQGAAH